MLRQQQAIEPLRHGPITSSMHVKNRIAAMPHGVMQVTQDLRYALSEYLGGRRHSQFMKASWTTENLTQMFIAADPDFKKKSKFVQIGDGVYLSMRGMHEITQTPMNWSKNPNERRPNKVNCYSQKCTHLGIMIPEDTQAWKKGPKRRTPGLAAIVRIDDWTKWVRRGFYIIPLDRIRNLALSESNKSRANIPKDVMYAMLIHSRNLGHVVPVPAPNPTAMYSITGGLTYLPPAS